MKNKLFQLNKKSFQPSPKIQLINSPNIKPIKTKLTLCLSVHHLNPQPTDKHEMIRVYKTKSL